MNQTTSITDGKVPVVKSAAQDTNAIQDAVNLIAIVGEKRCVAPFLPTVNRMSEVSTGDSNGWWHGIHIVRFRV